MLRNIQNTIPGGFKNYQRDVLPNAVVIIETADFELEVIQKTKVSIARSKAEEYDRNEEELADIHEGMGGEVNYTAQYWTNEQNFHNGFGGYYLDSHQGELTHTIKLDEKWCETFNSIQGTDNQKVTKLCEIHLLEVVLPELKAAV